MRLSKWMPILFLGKTSNDIYILARGSSVRLSKSEKNFPGLVQACDLFKFSRG